MRNRAKTYYQFITEAYIDDSGELQAFNSPKEGDYDHQMIEQIQIIGEYLEDAGADHVSLSYQSDPVYDFKITFEYQEVNYELLINLDANESLINIIIGDNIIGVYNDSIDSLFELLSNTGLDFLNY
jgi:hypothetical protein